MAGCRRLTIDEVDTVLSSCYDLFSLALAERLSTQFVVMLCTGLRIEECCHLRVGDVATGGKVAGILSAQRRYTKGKREGRTVPLNGFAQRQLSRWLQWSGLDRASPQAWLFPPTRGSKASHACYWYDRPVNGKSVRKALAKILTARGIGGPVSTHSFRKTFGWEIYKLSGFNILVAMRALGHTNPMTTMAYLDISGEEVAAAVGKLYAVA